MYRSPHPPPTKKKVCDFGGFLKKKMTTRFFDFLTGILSTIFPSTTTFLGNFGPFFGGEKNDSANSALKLIMINDLNEVIR